MQIVRLAERPDLIAPLVRAYEAEWPDWYGPDGPGDAAHDLRARARGEEGSTALVLLDEAGPAGTLAITRTGPAGFDHLGPWVGGGWVAAPLRRRGLGMPLLEAIVAEARSMGIDRLLVATATAGSLIRRAGWTELPPIDHDGQPLALFRLDLTQQGAAAGR